LLVVLNPFQDERELRFELENEVYSFSLAPLSFNSIVLKAAE